MHAPFNSNRNPIAFSGEEVDLWKLKSAREGTGRKHVQQKETPMKEKRKTERRNGEEG